MLQNFRQLTLEHYKNSLPSRKKFIIPPASRVAKHDPAKSAPGYVAFVHRMHCQLPRQRLDELFTAFFNTTDKTFWLDSSRTEGSNEGGTSNRFTFMRSEEDRVVKKW